MSANDSNANAYYERCVMNMDKRVVRVEIERNTQKKNMKEHTMFMMKGSNAMW